ncbi:MAG: caspase family protein [Ktedonobacteraceae bacterium]
MNRITKVRALIVGMDDYKDPNLLQRKLSYAAADAHAVTRTIARSNAFTVEKLETLTNAQGTHQRIWHSLNEVFPPHLNFDSNTIAIFYFAGHGFRDPHGGERTFLGCNDVEVANPMKGGSPLGNIHSLLLQSSAGCSIAIIDACFSGAIVALRIERETVAELARREFREMRGAGDKTIAIFAACRSEQSAREENERKHGVYTDELLQGWRDGKARDEEGNVDISGLAAYLNRRFADDDQIPVSNVLSGRPVLLWRHEPLAPGTKIVPPAPIEKSKLTAISERVKMQRVSQEVQEQEEKPLKERVRRLALPLIIAAAALLVCGLSTIFVEPLRLGFFALIFGLDIILAITAIGIHRVFGTMLALVQLPLLAGFAYQYFHWGVGIVPVASVLAFLAGFLWLFWLLLGGETLLLLVFSLEASMH